MPDNNNCFVLSQQNHHLQSTGAEIVDALLVIHLIHLIIFLLIGVYVGCSCPPPNSVGFIKVFIVILMVT